ncbi:glutathione S-transferase [Aspergillus indologenus CBS 114.80]|uniref:Glutathione S-transferase n=1 Tax=Aspergillus indologenus CBS 114.80 TaxID=1450541 RepID=A0A2V5HPF6_9EURO|nr:glutathione S-transferase [Aspergillus indologenus CBS 114.80]
MADLFTEATPSRVKDTKDLHLITCSTPNGKKVQILLEELKEVYGLDWTTSLIDLETNEQKQPWFLRLNPNGKIPIIIDRPSGEDPFPVMESSAELLYLVEKFDPDHHFHFATATHRSQLYQWLIFWHASGQPHQAGLNHFGRFAPVQVPYAVQRFKAETLRIYNVLELRLSDGLAGGDAREYLAGAGRGTYSIADINAYPWVRAWSTSTITEEEMGQFPHLKKWIQRIEARPAVLRGIGDQYDEEVHPELLLTTT